MVTWACATRISAKGQNGEVLYILRFLGKMHHHFLCCPGFNLRMIGVDILHAWHLGVCRDLIGSVLRVLSKLKIFRRGGNLEDQLSAASSSLRILQIPEIEFEPAPP